eukprot:scaffold10783_cov133-Skeletonema_dohrnii-CCMP3373.AAC.3
MKNAMNAEEGRQACKAAEESQSTEAFATSHQEVSAETPLDLQLQRLRIDSRSFQFLECIDNASSCDHGEPISTSWLDCKEFVIAFAYEFDNVVKVSGFDNAFPIARRATWEKFITVWESPAKMTSATSFYLANATQCVLNGNTEFGHCYATYAACLEQWMACTVHKSQAAMDVYKILEIHIGDMHTLVSYLRRRIPCCCLDETYVKFRSTKKIGLCRNPDCPLPNGQTKRSAMLQCTRCRLANYCSRECQVKEWPNHKRWCDNDAKARAEFDSKKKSS